MTMKNILILLLFPFILKGQNQDSFLILKASSAFETAFNQKDAKVFAALFTEDADFVNWFGQSAHGRQEIEAFHIPVFKQIHRTSVQKVERSVIRFIKPDVAAVDVHWSITGMTTPDGKPLPSRKGIAVSTMTKEKGVWLIKVFHNINLDPPVQDREAYRKKTIATIDSLMDYQSSLVLKQDTAAMNKFYPDDMRITNPFHQLIDKKKMLERVMADIIKYNVFEKKAEHYHFEGENTVVVIGRERVVPTVDAHRDDAGKEVNRRFTEVWFKRDGTWKRVIRHAHNVQ